jgi:membrane protease YdiL (CAAX protease family)
MIGLLIVGFALAGFFVLWLVQTAALRYVGAPQIWALPFRYSSESNFVRMALKLAIQVVIGIVIFGLPLAMGFDPVDYHLKWFLAPPWRSVLIALALTVGILGGYQLFNLLMGWVTLAPKYSSSKTIRKMIKNSITPLPLAIVEETMFRGVILGGILNAMPATTNGACLAIFVSAIIFSSMHFVRPLKKTVLPAFGLFAFGIVLGIAYYLTGRNCWAPIAIHSSGVWMVQMLRPFVVYRAPAWLIGYPSYPICGAVGLFSMAVLSVVLVLGVGA